MDKVALVLNVNGARRDVKVPAFARLSDVLREELGLRGTKVGCNAGDCGSCTVAIDGESVCACLVPVGTVGESEIATIESLHYLALGRRLQSAFLNAGAVQCGACTPGALMSAFVLLQGNLSPTRQQVRDGMAGVLCRCTGYQTIVDAVLEAACPSGQAHPSVDDRGIVGTRIARVDGAKKVNGDDFGDDVAPSDSLFLKVVRSPHHHARFTLPDLTTIVSKYGLVTTITAVDVPGAKTHGVFPQFRDQPVLAESHVRFRGEPVLVLVGECERLEAIDDAGLGIIWEPLDPILDPADALRVDAPQMHEDRPNNTLTAVHLERSSEKDIEPAVRAEVTSRTSFVEHAYIEPEAGYAELKAGVMIVGGCTQSPYADRTEIARILNFPEDQVRIVPSACGGGFGGKLDLSFQPFAVLAALKTGRPVRCTYSRSDSMIATPKRHPGRMSAKMSAASDGRLLAYEFEGDFDTGAYASFGPTIAIRVPTHACGPYRIENVKLFARTVYTNNPPSGAFRGFGVPQCTIVLETLVEDIAEMLCLDPLDLRLKNVLQTGDKNITGQVLSESVGIGQCLLKLKDDWGTSRCKAEDFNRQAVARNSSLRRGVGISCAMYGIGAIGSNPSTIRIALTRGGRFVLYSGAVDAGQGATTVVLQIAADSIGVAPGDFDLVLWDTARTEDAGKTSASRQTFVSGNAAKLAGEKLRTELLLRLNAGPSAELRVDGSKLVASEGSASREIDLAALPIVEADDAVFSAKATFDPQTDPLNDQYEGRFFASWAMGAMVSEVEVDMDLGTVRVTDTEIAFDVGKAVNPTLLEGQIHGGVAQGLGLALMEEYVPGRTENLHDYLIPTIGDMPRMKVHIVEDPASVGPYGAKGVGELAPIPVAPSIFNAIRHATGVRVTHAPITPSRLLAALRQVEK